jgi:HEAT repeat protein
VRVAAAAGLGQLRTTEARQALLAGLHQDDSRVRSASATALGEFHADAQAYAALVDALRTDPSYAAKAAAALSVGRSGVAGAFERLVAERVGTSETHVASALQAALAATGDERAMELLLADAGPGEPARLRVSALSALVSMKGVVTRHHTQELATVLTQALGDPYLPLQQMAQDTVAAFHLVQLEPQIAAATSGAPTLWQRKLALGVLEQLRAAPSDRE